MSGVKKNFLYNLVLVVGNYLFPLLTYPYVSRILGADNLGMYSYADGIVNYFVLFASFGIVPFGIREIARVKNNKEKTTRVYSTLLALNIILSFFAVLVLVAAVNLIPKFQDYRQFLFIGITKIVFSSFLIEWLFQGLSEFKYITIRATVVRALFVLGVFCFIRKPGDAPIYYFLVCLTIVCNALLNLGYSRKYVRFGIRKIHIGLFIVPILTFGFYVILTSLYTSFNVVYLGSVTNDTQVGYYHTATKLYGVLMSVISAFTDVVVPKVSEMVEAGKKEKLKEMASNTFEVIFALTLPVMIFSFFYAPFIINLISGKGYEGAIMPFRIVMVLLLVISIEQVLVMQFLMALKDSRCILVLCAIGASVGISLNILLVGKFQSTGSALSWMFSEISVMCVAIYFFQKYFEIRFPYQKFLKQLVWSVPYGFICFVFFKYTSYYILVPMSLMCVWFVVNNVCIQTNSEISYVTKKVFHSMRLREMNCAERIKKLIVVFEMWIKRNGR